MRRIIPYLPYFSLAVAVGCIVSMLAGVEVERVLCFGAGCFIIMLSVLTGHRPYGNLAFDYGKLSYYTSPVVLLSVGLAINGLALILLAILI